MLYSIWHLYEILMQQFTLYSYMQEKLGDNKQAEVLSQHSG